MEPKRIDECVKAALTGSRKFPEIVAELVGMGVEAYHVDMVRGENRYYAPSGESYVARNGIPPGRAAETFSAARVAAAVRCSQAGEISYPEFMERITAAGAVYYITYLRGRRVIYFGREGDFHVELFPGSR